MNAADITFGIELETLIPANSDIEVGGHGNGLLIRSEGLSDGWKADSDPSIERIGGERGRACEFVSPVFKGLDGLVKLARDLQWIKDHGAKVNQSCGLHIHIGFDKTNVAHLKNLIHTVACYEKGIYAATGTKRREVGRWCKPIAQHGDADAVRVACLNNRYHLLNTATPHPTVEFRAFDATLDIDAILAQVRLCIALVERATNATRPRAWSIKSIARKRGGPGQTMLCKLFYYLGWTKGQESKVYGQLEGEPLPSTAMSRRTLIDLAKQYDAPPAPLPGRSLPTRTPPATIPAI